MYITKATNKETELLRTCNYMYNFVCVLNLFATNVVPCIHSKIVILTGTQRASEREQEREREKIINDLAAS